MDPTTKQAFFLFFAIHLPPVEEGEFLLYYVKNGTKYSLYGSGI